MLTLDDLYRVRFEAERLNLTSPLAVMCRDTLLDAQKVMPPEQLVSERPPDRILGMPVKLAPYIPRGQIRLEEPNGIQHVVLFDTPATKPEGW